MKNILFAILIATIGLTFIACENNISGPVYPLTYFEITKTTLTTTTPNTKFNNVTTVTVFTDSCTSYSELTNKYKDIIDDNFYYDNKTGVKKSLYTVDGITFAMCSSTTYDFKIINKK